MATTTDQNCFISAKSAPLRRIRRMYWQLSHATDHLEIVEHAIDDLSDQVAVAVLLEDLELLQEECEELLVTPLAPRSLELESIEARSKTVLEEAEEFLKYIATLGYVSPRGESTRRLRMLANAERLATR